MQPTLFSSDPPGTLHAWVRLPRRHWLDLGPGTPEECDRAITEWKLHHSDYQHIETYVGANDPRKKVR